MKVLLRNSLVLAVVVASVAEGQQRPAADSTRRDTVRVKSVSDSVGRDPIRADSARRIGVMQVTATFAPTRGSCCRRRATSCTAATPRLTCRSPLCRPPPGYALWNLGAGGTLLVGSQVFILDASLRNVFDTAFRSFMSRYKEFANGPGRALVLGVTTEF